MSNNATNTSSETSLLLDAGDSLRVQELDIASCLHLHLASRSMARIVERAGGAPLPTNYEQSRLRVGDGQLLHLGDDQWLALDFIASPQVVSRALNKQPYSCIDLSYCLCKLRVNGAAAGATLQSVFANDIDPLAFPTNQVRLAKLAGVFAALLHNARNDYHLFVNRGYAQYVVEQLSDVY